MKMKLQSCRICGSQKLKDYLDLGEMPPADSFISDVKSERQRFFPLEVCVCEDCGMSQLNYTVPPEILYQNDYPYESSMTETGRNHFKSMADEIVDKYKIEKNSLVIDIGSNVGVLLQGFKSKNCRVLGIEPASNIADKANNNGIETINNFISSNLAEEIAGTYGQSEAICITNVFAHIHDLDDLMASIDKMLSPTGVFVIEAPHFLTLVKYLEYDTIYHEHLMYITVKPLEKIFSKYGFEISDLKNVSIHGGSIRIFVSRIGTRIISESVATMIKHEIDAGLFSLKTLNEFAEKVAEHRRNLRELIMGLKGKGYKIAAVSAPAKGMTLINYCGLDKEVLEFVTEKSELKKGKHTPGSLIPVCGDDKLLETQPDYALLLAWNFKEEIKRNLWQFKEEGGKFIIPIPKPTIE